MPDDPLKRPLRILITNNTLDQRAGSELFVRDLAVELIRRGHNPVAYSTVLGEVAGELERATVPVIDDLGMLGEPPDIIHGQHHHETMTAALRFPDRPVVFVCHGWIPWEEKPPLFPSIRRYVAVDDLCRERLLATVGIMPDQVSTIYNFADLDRFLPRPPLPRKPRSVLVFSNYASEIHEAIRTECLAFGIQRLDVVGLGSGSPTARPEEILPKYDLVFAKGRAAIEAMATGCAVVVADYSRTAGMVTSANLAELRRYNFGVRTLQRPLSRETVQQALASYDPADARNVTEFVRSSASLTGAADQYLAVYDDVGRAWCTRPGHSSTEESLALASRYLHWLSPAVKDRHNAQHRAARLELELSSARFENSGLREHKSLLEAELASIKASRGWRALRVYGRMKNRIRKP